MAEAKQKVAVYIEDEIELIDLLCLILRDENIVIKPALKGSDGLALVRQHKPDLVLLDLMLPDMEGWEVYREMRHDLSLRDVPVIVITVRTEGLLDGVWPQTEQLAGYLVKPFEVNELRQVVRCALKSAG